MECRLSSKLSMASPQRWLVGDDYASWEKDATKTMATFKYIMTMRITTIIINIMIIIVINDNNNNTTNNNNDILFVLYIYIYLYIYICVCIWQRITTIFLTPWNWSSILCLGSVAMTPWSNRPTFWVQRLERTEASIPTRRPTRSVRSWAWYSEDPGTMRNRNRNMTEN